MAEALSVCIIPLNSIPKCNDMSKDQKEQMIDFPDVLKDPNRRWQEMKLKAIGALEEVKEV